MKQIVPFSKDIVFNNDISEIMSISLDHDIKVNSNDLISGNFYITGTYRISDVSKNDLDFNYKVPFEISISDRYDCSSSSVDIDDFYYEVVDDNTLRVNISVIVDKLVEKEEIQVLDEKEELVSHERKVDDELLRLIDEVKGNDQLSNNVEDDVVIDVEDNEDRDVSTFKVIEDISNSDDDSYQVYSIYTIREGDSKDSILKKYKISIDDFNMYNEGIEIIPGVKLIIPTFKDE